jgi:hypothetical protein
MAAVQNTIILQREDDSMVNQIVTFLQSNRNLQKRKPVDQVLYPSFSCVPLVCRAHYRRGKIMRKGWCVLNVNHLIVKAQIHVGRKVS